MMKNKILIFLAIVLSLSLNAQEETNDSIEKVVADLLKPPQSTFEKIYLFKSEIEVLESSDLIVRETIKVHCKGIAIRRGIFRAIPNTYKTKQGAKFKVSYDVLEVLRDGVVEDYHTKNKNGVSYIYIGNENYFLPIGDYTYTIKYKTNKQIGYYEEYDEIYWNVNGVAWDFEIDKVEAIVTLPNNAKIDIFNAFTGKWGELGKDYKATKISDHQVKFSSSKPFRPFENLSIVVAWQKGVVVQPTKMDNFIQFLIDNLLILLGILGSLATFLIHLFNWKKVGVDPPTGTVIPMFKPPGDLSPSAMRYILKMKIDNKGFTSAIVSLATKGALNIEKKGGSFFLIKKNISSEIKISNSEKQILDLVFANGNSFEFDNTNHAVISNVINKFKLTEVKTHEELYFKLNRKFLIPGIILSILTIVSMFFLRGFELSNQFFIQMIPMAGFFAFSFRNMGTKNKNIGAIIMGIFFLVIFYFVSGFSNSNLTSLEITSLAVVFGLLLFINLFFAYLMRAPTFFGRKEMDKIEGFKMYLKTAEEHRLDAINLPNQTPQLFEKYLPYAIALDCENQWAKKFKNIIEDAIKAGTYTQPTWYIGHSRFNTNSFTNNIGNSLNSAVSSSSMAPSSGGGSGGGGFSGGGGGGGGGGGW